MTRTTLFLAAFLLAVPVTTAAQEQLTPAEEQLLAEPPSTTPSPVMDGLDTEAPDVVIPLKLADAVSAGIENNLQLQVERFDPLIAQEEYDSSWGAFDPLAKLDWDYVSQTSPLPINSLQGNQRSRYKESRGGVGIDTLIPYVGATFGVDLQLSEIREIGSPFISQRPVYDSGFSIRGSLPLLRASSGMLPGPGSRRPAWATTSPARTSGPT